MTKIQSKASKWTDMGCSTTLEVWLGLKKDLCWGG